MQELLRVQKRKQKTKKSVSSNSNTNITSVKMDNSGLRSHRTPRGWDAVTYRRPPPPTPAPSLPFFFVLRSCSSIQNSKHFLPLEFVHEMPPWHTGDNPLLSPCNIYLDFVTPPSRFNPVSGVTCVFTCPIHEPPLPPAIVRKAVPFPNNKRCFSYVPSTCTRLPQIIYQRRSAPPSSRTTTYCWNYKYYCLLRDKTGVRHENRGSPTCRPSTSLLPGTI